MHSNKERTIASAIFFIFLSLLIVGSQRDIPNDIKFNYKSGLKKSDQSPLIPKKGNFVNVEIEGAIKNPGKYRLEKGKKYFDLIELAGGAIRKCRSVPYQKKLLSQGRTTL